MTLGLEVNEVEVKVFDEPRLGNWEHWVCRHWIDRIECPRAWVLRPLWLDVRAPVLTFGRVINGLFGAVRPNGGCALGHRRTSIFRPVCRS